MIAVLLLATSVVFSTKASESVDHVTFFEDGSYIVTTITEIPSRAAGTKTGSKTGCVYTKDGELEYSFTITGTFYYNGSTSQCTYTDGTTSIVKINQFTVKSESSTQNGTTANYTVTIGRKTLGIVTSKETRSISLTCDKDGNLS